MFQARPAHLDSNEWARVWKSLDQLVHSAVVAQRNVSRCFDGIRRLRFVASTDSEDACGTELKCRSPKRADIDFGLSVEDSDFEEAA